MRHAKVSVSRVLLKWRAEEGEEQIETMLELSLQSTTLTAKSQLLLDLASMARPNTHFVLNGACLVACDGRRAKEAPDLFWRVVLCGNQINCTE
jgi:hypothetical protein